MNDRTVSTRGWLVFVAVTALAGCGGERGWAQASATGRDKSAAPAASRAGEQEVLQARTDARNRRWVLSVDDVRIYEGRMLVRRIALPNWSVARSVCLPDLALDRSGSAVIASNVQSKLWRIDADSFAVTEHEIVLQGKERWDIGFGAIAFAAGGNLYAMTSTGNSAWKIDLARGSASAVEFYSPPVKPCALTTELVNRFEKKRNS
jgi:hypothetical protein